MQLEATGQPIRYRLKTGEEFTLRPGVPMELPDQAANQLLQKAPDKVRRVSPVPAIQSGDRIEWQRADLSVQHGVVDCVCCDTDGQAWAFCTVPGESWTLVNMKFVRGSGHD